MDNQDQLKQRIQKGIAYFAGIKPSQWNESHTLHLHVFLNLLDEYMRGTKIDIVDLKEEQRFEQAKKLFE